MSDETSESATRALVPDAPKGPDPVDPGDHVFLIDGSGYIFRAYHALPPLTRKSDGMPVGAVAGFCNMLWKLLREEVEGQRPTHLAVVFDASHITFRNEIYEDYKAHRPPPPDDLIPQFGLIRRAVEAFCIACVEQDNYEADDLIATYARLARERGATATIVSSDKDLMQLVRDGVAMWDPMKGRMIGEAEVAERFGVAPDKVVEVQALIGDPTDNVPGVPGIGVKTAASLIADYGDLETLLARAGEIKQPKRREALIAHAEQARISRKLVLLEEDVPLTHALDALAVREPDAERLLTFLREMEFNTLTRRVAEAAGLDPESLPAPAPRRAEAEQPEGRAVRHVEGAEARAPAEGGRAAIGEASTPQALAEARAAEALATPCRHDDYECVTSLERLEAWIAEAHEAGEVAFDTETDGLDAMSARLVGVSLATAPGRACYVPLRHRASEGFDFGGEDLVQVSFDAALLRLRPLLEDPGVLKIGQNVKFDRLVMWREGVDLAPVDDTLLLSYALDAGKGAHGMDELARRWLGHDCVPFKEVAGTGRNQITFDLVPLDKATRYAAEDADVTLRLHRVLKPRLAAEGLATVYERLERPMIDVLSRMEGRGISVDRQILSRLSGEFAQKMGAVEADIHAMAGETFNLGSPKQLGDILFGRLGLPGGKKTKTGAWATRANVLEELAAGGNELAGKMLEWRQLSKLKSTYTDALPTYVNAETGRVHTSFSLAATTTGRLSSSEPNLQNIPVRTEEGRRIRTAFVAGEGHRLMSADYSQIELRILAHMADIAQLKQAFADGLDIHALTASEMFSVPVEGMDPLVRRRAKAINFGIIYGISAFGLANQLGIGREEARAYIARYFERFPGIRDYIEATKETARRQGYVTTLFGRRCHYPQINSKNPNERAFMERAAINAPIQGTAADILRRAMIRMDGALEEAGLKARMLLQVHDELVFELPSDEVEATVPVVARIMEHAALPAVDLAVPLAVEARAAGNWEEAH